MKTQLIQLPEQNIIVCDEKTFEINDMYLDDCHSIRQAITNSKDYWAQRTIYKKIIAGLPNQYEIDYNGLEEEFGVVDIKKLSRQIIGEDDILYQRRDGFIRGFKTAQSLNQKRWTDEDIRKAFEYFQFEPFPHNNTNHLSFDEFIEELSQPKVFDVEIEREEICCGNLGTSIKGNPVQDCCMFCSGRIGYYEPKITNNKIKILKVIK